MSFTPLSNALNLTAVGRASQIRRLNPLQLHIFLLMYSMCFKGHSFRRFNAINSYGVKQQLKLLYNLEITRRQFDYACSKFVKLGLLERTVANFPKTYGSQTLYTKTSFYRIRTK